MTELTGITWDHPRGFAPLQASTTAYPAAASLKITWQHRSLKDFGDAPLESLAAAFDLIVLDHPHMGVAAASNCILPFDTLISASDLAQLASESVGPSFTSYHYNGHQWALPLDAACQVSARRPDLLPDTQHPQSWDAVFSLAAALAANDLQLGMALCPTDCLCSFLTLCAQCGDPITEGRPTLVNPAVGTKALLRLAAIRDVAHPDSLRWNPIALFDHMADRHSRIAYAPLAFGYSNYARPRFADCPLAFGPIPCLRNALLGGAGIAISANCKAPTAAAAYALWLCSADYQSTGYTEFHGQPANAAAFTSPHADALSGHFLSATFSTLQAAYQRPRSPGWPAFQVFLGERIHHFLSHHNDAPDAVLSDLQQAYHASL